MGFVARPRHLSERVRYVWITLCRAVLSSNAVLRGEVKGRVQVREQQLADDSTLRNRTRRSAECRYDGSLRLHGSAFYAKASGPGPQNRGQLGQVIVRRNAWTSAVATGAVSEGPGQAQGRGTHSHCAEAAQLVRGAVRRQGLCPVGTLSDDDDGCNDVDPVTLVVDARYLREASAESHPCMVEGLAA